MPLVRVIEPAAAPLSALALQQQVRQDLDIDNAQLDYWIRAARRFAENKCGRTLIATRYKLVLDAFPGGASMGYSYGTPYTLPGTAILLERGPVLAVQSIKYLDMSGTQQTLATTEYVAELSGQLARITPRFGKVWPANTLPQIGAVEVIYDAGDAAGIAVNITTDVFTILGGVWRTLALGDAVRFTNSGGDLPSPLQPDTDYYIQSLPTASTFTLSTSAGGALLNITNAGYGTSYIGAVPEDVGSWMKLRIGGLYENREDAMVVNKGTLFEVPYMDRLLDDVTVRVY
jgi:uncharacterized phiE125 gp8 family phage protein